METPRMDLSPLDPTADRECWERLVHGITTKAAPELARRASAGDPLQLLGHWARPVLAAATVAALIAAALLSRTERPTALPAYATFEEALHVPQPAAVWLAENRSPTVTDLVRALEDEPR